MHQRLLSIVLCAALLCGGSAVLSGCDTTGTDTITLNTDTGLRPISYTFRYNQNDVENGEVTPIASPDTTGNDESLDTLLRRAAGASRSDIVSARVTKVEYARRTPSTSKADEQAKVFSYLTRAEVYLGDTSGGAIATKTIDSVPGPGLVDMNLGPGAGDVTGNLKNGPTMGVLRLQVANLDEVGTPDIIEVEVSYSIKVPSP